MSKERQATVAEFMGLKPYPERDMKSSADTGHDDKMLIFALRDENDALMAQCRELREVLKAALSVCAEKPDAWASEADMFLALREVARDCRAALAKVRS